MGNSWKMAALGILILAASACDGATGPGGPEGEMEMAAIGDERTAPEGSTAGEPQSAETGGTQSGGADGTVRIRARVYVRSEAGQWIEVTRRGAESATVRASGTGEAVVLGTARVAAGSYNRVRVRFEEVEANVVSFRIGVGPLLSGSFRVESQGSGGATVEREQAFEIHAGSSARLVMDLNSSAWLERANAQTRVVSRSDFEGAVRLRVE